MWTLFIYICIFIISAVLGKPPDVLHPLTGLQINEIVEKFGYPFESHNVITEDGYILTMHRIPHGKNNADTNAVRPPVLAMHGLLCSSADWVNTGPEQAIAFLLADAGYDVWLGNQRGNTWGKNSTAQKDPAEFYDFSFHEIGIYDIAAKIDYVLKATSQEKLSYIGYSQGTTAMFVLLSQKPEYNDKIKLFSALAPVAYMSHLKSPVVRFLADHYDNMTKILDEYHIVNLLDHNGVIQIFGETVCVDPELNLRDICAGLLFAIAGEDPGQFDYDFMPVIATNAPAGASSKQLLHYIQEVISGKFEQFNYGLKGNLDRYGQETPPQYDLTKITAPVSLHYATNDYLSSDVDVELLAQQLPNIVSKKLVPYKDFNHLDYLWAIDLAKLINNHVLAEINAVNGV